MRMAEWYDAQREAAELEADALAWERGHCIEHGCPVTECDDGCEFAGQWLLAHGEAA